MDFDSRVSLLYAEPLPSDCKCDEKACASKNQPGTKNYSTSDTSAPLSKRTRSLASINHQFSSLQFLHEISRYKFWHEYSHREIDLRHLIGHASVIDHLRQGSHLQPERSSSKNIQSGNKEPKDKHDNRRCIARKQNDYNQPLQSSDSADGSDSSDSSEMSDYEEFLNDLRLLR